MPGETAYTRINRVSGVTGGSSPENMLPKLPSETGSFKSLRTSSNFPMRSLWPLVLLVVVAGALLLSAASRVHSSVSITAQPEHLTRTIEQLSSNQAAMMQMLQKLAGNASAGQPEAAAQRQYSKAEPQQIPAAFAALPVLTTLHNQLLRRSHRYEQHRSTMHEIFNQLVHLPQAEVLKAIDSRLQTARHPMERFALQLYKLLFSSEKLIPCREDDSLVLHDADIAAAGHGRSSSGHSYLHLWGHSQSHSDSSSRSTNNTTLPLLRYYFATNLRDNSVNMPQYILSLLQTLLRLPQDAAFVSAYESNSDDGAHGWVDVLQLALNVIGTPSRLVTRGMLVRLDGSHRIEHLARVRNMALAPLYQHYAAAEHKATNSTTSSSRSGSESGASGVGPARGLLADSMLQANSQHSGSSKPDSSMRKLQATGPLEALVSVDDAANLPPGVLPWDPDFIVFVNDVYFCWSQVIRLLNYKADITCGMDFWQNRDATVELPESLAFKGHKSKPSFPSVYKLERPIDKPYAPDQENPVVFYDVWVSRDLDGSKLWWTYPFVHHSGTRHAATQGLPFRASCCWNGLAVLKAAPFKAGLRIRQPMDGECQGSECTMVCNDFARLGYDYVVVDAGVQLTYDWDLAREMLAVGLEGYGQSSWAQVKAAGIAGRGLKPKYNNMECCGLRSRTTQWVNFNTDCYREDIFSTNFTDKVLKGN